MPSTNPPRPMPSSVPAAISGRRLVTLRMAIPSERSGSSVPAPSPVGRPLRDAEVDGGRDDQEDPERQQDGEQVEGELVVINPRGLAGRSRPGTAGRRRQAKSGPGAPGSSGILGGACASGRRLLSGGRVGPGRGAGRPHRTSTSIGRTWLITASRRSSSRSIGCDRPRRVGRPGHQRVLPGGAGVLPVVLPEPPGRTASARRAASRPAQDFPPSALNSTFVTSSSPAHAAPYTRYGVCLRGPPRRAPGRAIWDLTWSR